MELRAIQLVQVMLMSQRLLAIGLNKSMCPDRVAKGLAALNGSIGNLVHCSELHFDAINIGHVSAGAHV